MKAKKKFKNILLIEGNLFFAQKIKDSMDLLGYNLDISNNPDLAMESIKASKFDLIILDSSLSRISIKDVVDTVKRNKSSVPVLVTSDNPDLDLKEAALKAGASDFFLKRFELDKLLLKIYKLP